MSTINRLQPNMAIRVVYHSKDGTWRGFCAPYDISCTAKTAKEAMKRIDGLFELYQEGLKKYGHPAHLAIKGISDEEDRRIFEKVLVHVSKDIAKNIQADFDAFVKQRETSFSLPSLKATGSYSYPMSAFAY